MRKITGLNYYYKLDCMIKECIEKAALNPFEQFIFIVEDKKMVEKRFFLYTHHLVNIEIMTFNQYLRQLQVKHHLTHHKVVSDTELTYHLYTLLKENVYQCFNTDKPYPLIKELIKLVKDIDLHQTFYFSSHPKLNDFMRIYSEVKDKLDFHTHFSLERLLYEHEFVEEKQHIYIECNHIVEKLRLDFIEKLSRFHDITLMYTWDNDSRLFNLPHHLTEYTIIDEETDMTKQLFSRSNYKTDNIAYTIKEATPLSEVKRVVYTILQDIADNNHKYEDYMIIYPDDTYKVLLEHILTSKNIPHNLKITESCVYDYDYKFIINKIDDINASTMKEYCDVLLEDNLEQSYKTYLKDISYDYPMTNSEFKEFFVNTYNMNHNKVNTLRDVINVVPIEKAKSHNKKHIFILGMNETVLPALIKDTSLLLDEDIKGLREIHIPTPLTTLERLGLIQNDILKALQCPYHTLTLSYCANDLTGKVKLPSSLYLQLEKIFNFIELKPNTYMSKDDFYLLGGTYKNDVINDHIEYYTTLKGKLNSLNKDIVSSLYKKTLSVSQIETYNKCPYLYFIQYGLGIYPSHDNELKSNELGSLVHYILSKCLNEDHDIDSLVDYYLSKNEIILHKVNQSALNQYFIEQLKKDLKLTLSVLHSINDKTKFSNTSLEEKVEDTIHSLNFKGFVDRVDTYENYLSIIDYKSSSKDIDLNLAMQGFNIQMLLYLKMMTKKYEKDPAAVLYFNTKRRVLASSDSIFNTFSESDFESMYKFGGYIIDDNGSVIKAIDPTMDKKSNIINVSYVKKDGKYKGHILTSKQLQLLFEHIENHIYELYENMIEGYIDIAPKGSDDNTTHTKVNPCRYCDYRSVCHFDIFYNEYKNVEFYDIKEKLGGE